MASAGVANPNLPIVRLDGTHSFTLNKGRFSSPSWYDRCKAALDRLGALLMLILSLPVMILAAVAVKLTSRGTVFYSQVRLGRGGKPFFIYKLRTMVHNCEHHSGIRWSTPGDSRVTFVGRFLRRTHLDELPQLWNILRGDMSLVGPRPERPEFVPQLARALPRYHDRLRVRPGLSGLAQIQLPPDTDLDSVRRKLAYDLFYIEKNSFWLDFRILLSTALRVLGLPYYLSARLFALPAGEPIERAYALSVSPILLIDQRDLDKKAPLEAANEAPPVPDFQPA